MSHMKLLSGFSSVFFSVVFAASAEARTELSLNGLWDYVVDPQDVGEEFGFPKDRPLGGTDLVQQDFDAAPKMRLPSDWNTADPRLDLYEGSVWFRRTFDFDAKPGVCVILRFGAANYRADVWLDGVKLGFHEGGFTPFSFDATDLLAKGRAHRLIVRVNNARTRERVPALSFDWWNYGGLTRDISLVQVPVVHVADAMLQLAKDGGRLVGFVRANVRAAGIAARIAIPELGVRAEAKTDDAGVASFSIAAKPVRWSPENPMLYAVTFSVGDDELADAVGFRTIETRGREILLNGQRVFLKGACLHDEKLAGGGRVTCEADAACAIRLAKAMGCNFLRLAHYPHHEATVRLADREGVMLWCETPVYWSIDWENAETFAAAREQVSEMVVRDRNRASVIIWSVANETPHSPARDKFLTGLVRRVRELDPTRLVSLAMDLRERDGLKCVIRDNLEPIVDIVSFNQYVGWYWASFEEAERVEWIVPYEKPVVISEFGGGAVAGRHGPASERWTEEFQAELYRANLKMLRKIPGLSGLAPWILADFRSPRRPCHGVQDYFNRKGLADEKGKPKKAFGVMREFYTQEKRK